MNLSLARRYLDQAVIQRDCALWFEQRARATPSPTFAERARSSAFNCRIQMRLAAKRMVDHLRPIEAMRELRALGARQLARDITPASFSVRSAGASAR